MRDGSGTGRGVPRRVRGQKLENKEAVSEALGSQELAQQRILRDKMTKRVTKGELLSELQPIAQYTIAVAEQVTGLGTRLESVIAYLAKNNEGFREFFKDMTGRQQLWQTVIRSFRETPPNTIQDAMERLKAWHGDPDNPKIKAHMLDGNMVIGLVRADLDSPKDEKIAFLREIGLEEEQISGIIEQIEKDLTPTEPVV